MSADSFVFPTLPPLEEHIKEGFRNKLMASGQYGRMCKWNGQDLAITQGASPLVIQDEEGPGTFKELITVTCLKVDLPQPPVPTQEVNLDGRRWLVADIKAPFAHYIITLARSSG